MMPLLVCPTATGRHAAGMAGQRQLHLPPHGCRVQCSPHFCQLVYPATTRYAFSFPAPCCLGCTFLRSVVHLHCPVKSCVCHFKKRQSLASRSTAVRTTVASSLAANITRKCRRSDCEAPAAAPSTAADPARSSCAAAAPEGCACASTAAPCCATGASAAAASCAAAGACSCASNTYTGLGLPPNLDMRRLSVPWRSTASTSSAATCLGRGCRHMRQLREI